MVTPFIHNSILSDGGDYISLGYYMAGYPVEFGRSWMRPPFIPFLFSLFYRVSTDWPVTWIATWTIPVICCLGMIFLYKLLSETVNREVGLLASILLTTNYIHWYYSNQVRVEAPAGALVVVCAYLFWKGIHGSNKHLYACGALTAIACMTKFFAGLLFPFYIGYILTTKKTRVFRERHIWISIAICLLTFSPWLAFNALNFGSPIIPIQVEGSYIFYVNPRGEAYWYSYIQGLPFFLNASGAALFVLGLILTIRELRKDPPRRDQNLFLLLFMLAMYGGLNVFPNKWEFTRYSSFFIPSLIPFIAIGLQAFRKFRLYPYLIVLVAVATNQIHPLLIFDLSLSPLSISIIPPVGVLKGFAIPKIVDWSTLSPESFDPIVAVSKFI